MKIGFCGTMSVGKTTLVKSLELLPQFKDYHIGYMENGDEELKHCYPYEFKLDMDYERRKL